jgi:hypothetical protein
VTELVRLAQSLDEMRPAGIQEGDISVQHALSIRISSSSEQFLSLLQIIAIAGRPITQSVALEAANLLPGDRAVLSQLKSARLIRATGPSLSDHVDVYHDRVRVEVIQTMPVVQRRTCHARLALTLEAKRMTSADQLADHFRNAGMPVQAAKYTRVAAEEAKRALALERATELSRWASSLLSAEEANRVRRGAVLGAFAGLQCAVVIFGLFTYFDRPQSMLLNTVARFIMAVMGGAIIGMVLGSIASLFLPSRSRAVADTKPALSDQDSDDNDTS